MPKWRMCTWTHLNTHVSDAFAHRQSSHCTREKQALVFPSHPCVTNDLSRARLCEWTTKQSPPSNESLSRLKNSNNQHPSTKKHQCYFLMPWSERHLSLQLSLPMWLTTSAHANGRPAGNETWLAEKSIRMEVCSSENQRQMDTSMGDIHCYDWLPKAKTNLVSASDLQYTNTI